MPPIRHTKSIAEKKRMHEINHEPCLVCGFVVKYKCDIARHRRQHAENQEEIMTPCPWPDCEYKSLQRSNVTVHARKQHNWKIHHCRPTCKFSAVLMKDLAQHRQEVHGTKCTITEWEAEGPIDPDRAPRKPYNKEQKSQETLDALLPSISEERAATLSALSSSASRERHIPTYPHTIRYLEPSFGDARDGAYNYGAYKPKYGLDASNIPAWLVFEKLGQQQQHPAQRQQLQLSWNPMAWNTIPTQGRGNLLFSFENPSSSFIPARQIRHQLNRAFKNTICHSPMAHDPYTIPGSIIGGLPVPSETIASFSMPAQQQLQPPEIRNPAIEKALYSRFPLTYKLYNELQAQQKLTAQPQQPQKLTWDPVIENTAVPEVSAASKAPASDMGATLDTLSGMEHVSPWDNVAFPTGLNVNYDNAPLVSLNENPALGLRI